MAQQDRTKHIYHNEIPQMPADAIMPMFEIPTLSTDFTYDSPLYTQNSNALIGDRFLGVKVEFTDFSVYNENASADDFKDSEFAYLPHERLSTASIPQTIPREKAFNMHEKSHLHDEHKSSTHYLKSSTISSTDDPQINEQLKAAFGGNVPEGKVRLIKKNENLFKIQIIGSEYLPSDGLILESGKGQYVRVLPKDGGEPRSSYNVKTREEKWGYFKEDEDGNFLLAVSNDQMYAKRMTARNMKTNPHTGRFVNLQ